MATKQRIPGQTINPNTKAYGMGRDIIMVNPIYGNGSGFTPDLDNFINYTPYLRRNLVPVLVEAPRGFLDVAGGMECIAILKALMETGYRSFEGLNATIESQFAETEMGGDGTQFAVLSDNKYAQSAPSYAFVEREGRPIGTFFDWWRTEFGMDPVSKVPNIITRGVQVPDLLPDYTTATMLYFEPSKNWRKVDKAWLCFNMFPRNGAPVEGYRDLNRAGELVEFNIEFTCIQQISKGVYRFAQEILETFSIFNASSYQKVSVWTGIDANVAASTTGFNDELKKQTAKAIKN